MKKLTVILFFGVIMCAAQAEGSAASVHFTVSSHKYGTSIYSVPGFKVSHVKGGTVFKISEANLISWHKHSFPKFSESDVALLKKDFKNATYPSSLDHAFSSVYSKGTTYKQCLTSFARGYFIITCDQS